MWDMRASVCTRSRLPMLTACSGRMGLCVATIPATAFCCSEGGVSICRRLDHLWQVSLSGLPSRARRRVSRRGWRRPRHPICATKPRGRRQWRPGGCDPVRSRFAPHVWRGDRAGGPHRSRRAQHAGGCDVLAATEQWGGLRSGVLPIRRCCVPCCVTGCVAGCGL